jgi:hypothetical protein
MYKTSIKISGTQISREVKTDILLQYSDVWYSYCIGVSYVALYMWHSYTCFLWVSVNVT